MGRGVGRGRQMRRFKVHRVWWIAIGALLFLSALNVLANAQGLTVDRINTRHLVRDMLGEPQVTYLPDSTLNRFVNYGQHLTMLALSEKTSVVVDTILTTVGRLRYELAPTAPNPATVDTIMASRVATVISKGSTASGSEEVALAYIPPDLLGKPQSGTVPAFYSVIGRNLLLGKSPLAGDTLFVYMVRVPRDLSADATLLSVSKEDQLAVALSACVFASLRDKQVTAAQQYWQLWQAATGFKGYPQFQEPTGGP